MSSLLIILYGADMFVNSICVTATG